ncbi:hypothetical protein [Deinococcus planocerae]|uniref:hypothetical protein n=1 Tax=Deinococcus planocerae TaxID=1737569 RepID=UPI001FE85506|nr:hypothetical protein [Deinococcus planocerae]
MGRPPSSRGRTRTPPSGQAPEAEARTIPGILTLRWMPGTTDRVHFDTLGHTFTVLPRDVQHVGVHSPSPLSDLIGPLRQHVTPSVPGTHRAAWVNGGGRAGDEPVPEEGP